MSEHTKDYFVATGFYGETIFNINQFWEFRCKEKPISYLVVY
jgi:hypothetical protein